MMSPCYKNICIAGYVLAAIGAIKHYRRERSDESAIYALGGIVSLCCGIMWLTGAEQPERK